MKHANELHPHHMTSEVIEFDYLIVGAGIIGMSIAYELQKQYPSASIVIVEKESGVAQHASGRNSGVLHAGFYYSADSLKAKLTVDGNRKMRQFCKDNDIAIKETKKVVVAKDEKELAGLYELKRRAKVNGVEVDMLNKEQLKEIDQNIKTYKKALFSPTTASVNPKEVCFKLRDILQKSGVCFVFNRKFEDSDFTYKYLINSAGSYADTIAKGFGLAKRYTMLPFKGVYLKYQGDSSAIKVNIYPVPNLSNPFLGVHYTITSDGSIKIGPTAIPVFWRENYGGFDNFNLKEMINIVYYEVKLFALNSFNFRSLAINEMKNYNKKQFIKKAQAMVFNIDNNFTAMPSGIRSQLLDTTTNELVQDFIVEYTERSTHILNAVSPAFTCSFAFAEYIVDRINKNRGC